MLLNFVLFNNNNSQIILQQPSTTNMSQVDTPYHQGSSLPLEASRSGSEFL